MPTLVPRASSNKQDEPVSAAGAAVGTVLGAFVLVGSYILVQGVRKLRRKKERVQGATDSPPPPPSFSPPGDEKGLLSSPDNWWRKRLAGGSRIHRQTSPRGGSLTCTARGSMAAVTPEAEQEAPSLPMERETGCCFF